MKINWSRFVLGGIIASIILFVTDGFIHEKVLNQDWMGVYAALRAVMPVETPKNLIYFAVFELGRGFIGMFVYVLMRPCCQPGPKTAVLAGVVAWIAFSVTGPAQFVPLGFLSNALWIKMILIQLITSIVAAIVGAALYKD
jgi:hypothetical protein